MLEAGKRSRAEAEGVTNTEHATVGKQTLVEQLPVQRRADGAAAEPAAPPAAAPAGGAGKPLDPATRSLMEGSFGADFSSVRVHEGASARAHGAVAYAQGEDLHFQPGAYSPQSSQGRELIGHELTHVVQQRAGRVATPQGKGGINADTSLEQEADSAGTRAARGEQVSVSGQASAPASAAGPLQLNTDSVLEYLAPLLAAGVTAGTTLTPVEQEACEEAADGGLDFLAAETPEALLATRVLTELRAKLQRIVEADPSVQRRHGRAMKKLDDMAKSWGSEAAKTESKTDPADVTEWATKGETANKNKLYIGGGAEIDAKAISNPLKVADKKSRILDVEPDKWTWFVNTAWMKAGMDNDARFKLTTQLTDDIKDLLLKGGITGDQFLAEVGRTIAPLGTPHPLWHSGDARATYFAHEIAMLLDAGYLFQEVGRANQPGTKQQFTR